MSDSDATIKTFLDSEQLRADLSIDTTRISEQLSQQASLYVHYAGYTVRAKMQLDRWNRALEVLEAQLSKHYREALCETPDPNATSTKKASGKPTEPQIVAAIHSDVRYKTVRAKQALAEEAYRMCQAAERGFEQRKDMLLQIARDQSKEREGSLRVLGNQNAQERAKGLLDSMKSRQAEGSQN
jgi:hypothetical protein